MDDSIKSKIYYPMLVSNKGTNEPLTKEEDALIWKKYLTLPQGNKDILTSYELPRKVKELQNKYSFSDAILGQVSLSLRKVFFGEMDMTGLTTFLTQTESNTNKVTEIVQFIDKDILHLIPKIPVESEDTPKEKTVTIKQLPLLKAITQYENLGQQLVTNEKIKIKSQPEPVRPSLANWIHYYRDELGIGFHDQVVRGRFLFQSENGKKLNNEERERINLILKSIEEDYPIDIDTDRSVIVFPSVTRGTDESRGKLPFSAFNQVVPAREVKPFQPTAPIAPAPPTPSIPAPVPPKTSFFSNKFGPAKNVAGETLHFSTGHVLPGEKERVVPASSPAPQPVPPQSTPTAPSATPLAADFQPGGINRNITHTLPRSPYSIRPLRLRSDNHPEENV